MKLEFIKQHASDFGRVLTGGDGSLHTFKYAMLKNFQTNWNSRAGDLGTMFERCLESDVTRRWWKREGYRPKESMLLLLKVEPHLIMKAFEELFNEAHELENRIDRFVYYCDDVLKLYKRADSRSIVNNHYQDSTILSLYLAAIYPEKYTLYPGRRIFNRALETLGAAGTGEKDDLPRYFKVSRTLHQYLIKDSSVKGLINSGLRPANNLTLAHEFVMALAGAWEEIAPE